MNIHWKDWCWSSNTSATWCEELTHWKNPWCWERLKVGGERYDTGWDGWMASPSWWTWIWASSGSWWWTGNPGVLQSMGSQIVGHNWTIELTDSIYKWGTWDLVTLSHLSLFKELGGWWWDWTKCRDLNLLGVAGKFDDLPTTPRFNMICSGKQGRHSG